MDRVLPDLLHQLIQSRQEKNKNMLAFEAETLNKLFFMTFLSNKSRTEKKVVFLILAQCQKAKPRFLLISRVVVHFVSGRHLKLNVGHLV